MSRSHDRFATRRRVLRPETTVEHVDEFAKGFQWPMVSVTERDREAGTDGEVVWQADGHTLGKRTLKTGSLRYVQDAMFGIGYIYLTGDPQNVVETLASTADQTLRPWTVPDLCQALDQSADPRSRGQAVLRLGLAAPGKPDRHVSERIGAALADGDARVRYASVFAASYTGYRDLLPHLRAIAERDAEEFLRERAATALRAMDGVKV
ncbi:HEAT repeat domain-containing protein [Actinomadura sp. 21ATH]|uniref:HEAT repeat domain-containing protein n=1 Tax=Actinomadura sp. 21ATH TaxID=1735444 RepID=UPI0035C072C6